METSSDQILELTGNKFNATIITVFKHLKENVAVIIGEASQKNGNVIKRKKFYN